MTSKDRNGTFSHFFFTNGFSTYGLIMNNVVKVDSIRQKKIYLAFYLRSASYTHVEVERTEIFYNGSARRSNT